MVGPRKSSKRERVCIIVYVCPNILAPGARARGPIGTVEVSYDAPLQRKDDGANHGVICATLHVPRAAAQTAATVI